MPGQTATSRARRNLSSKARAGELILAAAARCRRANHPAACRSKRSLRTRGELSRKLVTRPSELRSNCSTPALARKSSPKDSDAQAAKARTITHDRLQVARLARILFAPDVTEHTEGARNSSCLAPSYILCVSLHQSAVFPGLFAESRHAFTRTAGPPNDFRKAGRRLYSCLAFSVVLRVELHARIVGDIDPHVDVGRTAIVPDE